MKQPTSIALWIAMGIMMGLTTPLDGRPQTVVAQTPEAFPIPLAQTSPPQITVQDLGRFDGTVNSLAVSPDGMILLVGTGDGSVTAFDLRDLSQIYQQSIIGQALSIAMTSDNQYFAVTLKDAIAIYNLEEGRRLRTLRGNQGGISRLAISPDNQRLAGASKSDRTARVWDFESGSLLETIGEHIGWVGGVAFSPDSTRLATGAGGTDRTVKVWDGDSFELLWSTPQQGGPIWDVAFTPDGQTVLAIVKNRVIAWEVETGAERLQMQGPRLDLRQLAVSPDGQMVAAAGSDRNITLWDINSGQLLTKLVGHQAYVVAVAFSPDGRYLFSGSEDKTVKIWDMLGEADQQSRRLMSIEALISNSPKPDCPP